jgi:hypothetical protein
MYYIYIHISISYIYIASIIIRGDAHHAGWPAVVVLALCLVAAAAA